MYEMASIYCMTGISKRNSCIACTLNETRELIKKKKKGLKKNPNLLISQSTSLGLESSFKSCR
jgi:hypothetical protein